jgi:tetratricopeptide (TPR) repeat protein
MSKQAEIANDRAIEYWKQNRFDVAITQWEQASQNYPDVAEIHHNLGNAYVHQGQAEKAIESLKRAINADPSLVVAYNKLGCVYYKQGNLDLAFASWQQALKIQPDFQEASHNLRLLQKATQLNPGSDIPTYQQTTEGSPGNERHPKPVAGNRRSRAGKEDLTWTNRARRRLKKLVSGGADADKE